MFNLLKKREIEEEKFNTQIQTLFNFCASKYQKIFYLDRRQAERKATLIINDWIKNGKIEKKIKQMWHDKM